MKDQVSDKRIAKIIGTRSEILDLSDEEIDQFIEWQPTNQYWPLVRELRQEERQLRNVR